MQFHKKTISFRISLITAFLLLITFTVITIVLTSHQTNAKSIQLLTQELMLKITNSVYEKTINYLQPGQNILDSNDNLIEKGIIHHDNFSDIEKILKQNLETYPQFKNAYWYDISTEQFFMVARMPDNTLSTKHIVSTQTTLITTWKHSNPNYNDQYPSTQEPLTLSNDLKQREWYKVTMSKNLKQHIWSEIYTFATMSELGITVSLPCKNNTNIVGIFSIDITINELSNFLAKHKIGKEGFVVFINNKNDIITSDGIKTSQENLFAKIYKSKETIYTIKNLKKTYLIATQHFNDELLHQWSISSIVAYNDILSPIYRNTLMGVIYSIVSFIFASIFSIIISHKISYSLNALSKETEKIKNFELDQPFDLNSRFTEIYKVIVSVRNMKKGLRSFKKYIPADIVRTLIQTGTEAVPGCSKTFLTVLFSDISKFTKISEELHPNELVQMLSEYFNTMSHAITLHEGTIDKYIGDSILAFWGAPLYVDDHATKACYSALYNQDCIKKLNEKWQLQGRPKFNIRIGINTGNLIVGNIGSDDRLNYTVMGHTVNLTNRLEEINKIYGSNIIISHATYNALDKNKIETRMLDKVSIQGLHSNVIIYEVLSKHGELSKNTSLLKNNYEKALNMYFNRKWSKAISLFEQCLKINSNDLASKLLISRCKKFQKKPPHKEWDGTTDITIKASD